MVYVTMALLRPTSELCMCASVSEMIGTRNTSWLNHRHERTVAAELQHLPVEGLYSNKLF